MTALSAIADLQPLLLDRPNLLLCGEGQHRAHSAGCCDNAKCQLLASICAARVAFPLRTSPGDLP